MARKKNLSVALSLLLALSACATHKIAPPSERPAAAREFDRYLSEGILLLQRGDYEGAVRKFSAAQPLNPKSARVHNLVGIAYFRQQDFSSAEAQFLKAISVDPVYADAYNNLGGAYFAGRQFAMAERMYKKAMTLSPGSVSPYYCLGTLLLIQGRGDEGARYLARGIELDPQFLDTHSALAVDVPSPGADWSETYFIYAKLYARTGQLKQAFEFLKKAQKAGFHDWKRIMEDHDFENLRSDPRIREFIQQNAPLSPQGAGP
jgi:Flp pilus assembly protein TadD